MRKNKNTGRLGRIKPEEARQIIRTFEINIPVPTYDLEKLNQALTMADKALKIMQIFEEEERNLCSKYSECNDNCIYEKIWRIINENE